MNVIIVQSRLQEFLIMHMYATYVFNYNEVTVVHALNMAAHEHRHDILCMKT